MSAPVPPGLLAIVGPTGVGKSELALRVADELASRGRTAEVVNADAMQLYRGMDIGTAKLGPGERNGVPHRMLDVLDVREEASVAWYQPLARAAIDAAMGRGAVPILVGGSGLYVSSVLYRLCFPPRDPGLRARLERSLAQDGAEALHARLRARDPAAADRVDRDNPRRLLRALEVAELGAGGSVGALPSEPRPWRPARVVVLEQDRDVLVPRLEARVERMWTAGLVEEVAALREAGLEDGPTASRAIGYGQALRQLRGEASREEAIAETQLLTRRYAKRQRSWFRRYAGTLRLDAGAPDPVAAVLEGADF